MNRAILRRWSEPDTILLATNLEDAPHLVSHVIAQAKCSDATVLLVHVIEPTPIKADPLNGQPFVLPGPIVRSAQMNLNRIVKQFQQEGILCESIILEGTPGNQISSLVKERNVDRVVVGTRSPETIERLLLGSVAESLLHEVDVPVCVIGPHVRPQVHPDSEPKSILFATSLHRKSQDSAQLALAIANLHQARLTLLHVITPEHSDKKKHQQLCEQRKGDLVRLITEETKIWSSPSIAIREGNPATEILVEASQMHADLIILGTTGASKAERLLAAGVVYHVITMSKAPVITLRQEERISDERVEIPKAMDNSLAI